ncbi:acyltransferase family protein [Photobacterium phosphoreum]|nr:acyltransferase family protein [Photobacterium phosphoreum]MCF2176310.1 acyltransferase family protein [Photobacterium phosphoreum]
MKFRTDINGLRAIAVMAVVLFHFNPSWVPGGFAGVDVFFVISGFLMTGLIFRGLENNNFSIINFYVARANRIIPALSVVCLALLVFGWFYLTPLDYRTLGKHVASSMGFVSNIIYWRESGYFDAASHSKWLLHTWSLSVEWQFYMIYPVVLVLLKKCMSLTNIKRLLVVGTVVGFIFSVYATYKMPNASYFLFPTRAWEMMMGGLAFLYPLQNLKETSKKYLEWVGIALILASYALISKDNLWPGYLALIPVLGAYLVIIANRSGSVITDNIVMQKVGLWSYSIYLWHWPVVVFGYYFEMQHWEWIGIPISVVLGFCSYKFVESIKFPALSSISFKPIVTFKPLWMVILISVFSVIVQIDNGIYQRLNPNMQVKLKLIEDQTQRPAYDRGCFDYHPVPACTYYDGTKLTNNKPSHILLGDSHGQALVNGIAQSLSALPDYTGLKFYGIAGCLFSENIGGIYGWAKECEQLTKRTIKEINEKYPNIPIIFVSRLSNVILGDNKQSAPIDSFNNYIKLKVDLISTINKLSKDRNIYFLTPTPEFETFIPEYMARNYFLGKNKRVFESVHEYEKRNKLALELLNEVSKNKKVKILDVKPYFCDKNYCYGDDNGIPLYRDDDHVSEYGNKILIPLFNKIS